MTREPKDEISLNIECDGDNVFEGLNEEEGLDLIEDMIQIISETFREMMLEDLNEEMTQEEED